MAYINVDFEDLFGKSVTDCTRRPRIFMPLVIGLVLSLVTSAIFVFMNESKLYPPGLIFGWILLITLGVLVQFWFYEEVRETVRKRPLRATDAFLRAAGLLPRVIGAVAVFLLVITVAAALLVLPALLVWFSVLPLVLKVACFVFLGIIGLIALFYASITGTYLTPIIFLEKTPWRRCAKDALIHASNKKLETFIVLLILSMISGIASAPLMAFSAFSAQSGLSSTALYYNPWYFLLSLPSILVSAYSVMLIFNLYLMQKKVLRKYR